MNKLFLAGTVVQKGKKSIVMETTEVTATSEFTETHIVHMKPPKELNEGERIKLTGKLERTKENITIISGDPNTIEPFDEPQDMNVCCITGKAYRSFEYYPRTDTSAAFGNLLISNDEQPDLIVRGVAFQHLGITLNRTAKRGAEVRLQGRIRHRPYDAQGEQRTMLEIIADPDWTQVTKEAVMVDLFAEEAEPEAAAI